MTKLLKPFGEKKYISPEEALKEIAKLPDAEDSANKENEELNFLKSTGNYILMPNVDSYPRAVDALRNWAASPHPLFTKDDGSKIFRPLTLKENIEARVNEYSTLKNEQRLLLFDSWLDSCTGIAYKKGTSKFKLLPLCEQLILIDKEFDKEYLAVDYESLPGIELDKEDARYDIRLFKEEVLNHPAWNAVVEGDTNLLKEYADIIFSLLKEKKKAMEFGIRSHLKDDELSELCIHCGYGDDATEYASINDSGSLIDFYVCFAQVTKLK